jgi:hypothetical protein
MGGQDHRQPCWPDKSALGVGHDKYLFAGFGDVLFADGWRISRHSDFSDQRPYPSNRKSSRAVVIHENDNREGCAKALTSDRKLSYFGNLLQHGTASDPTP